LAGDDKPLDLTDRRRAEEAVRESQELLRLVLATLPVGVSVIDQSGDVVLANAASNLIWGGIIASGQERYARTAAFWHGSGKPIAPTEWARVQAESALRESTERLQHFSRRLLTVQEEERRHLSRELHDEFGQMLAGITLHLQAAKVLAGGAARSRLEECVVLIQHAGVQLGRLVLELRPTMLESAGLAPTLKWLAKQHEERTGMATQVVGQLNDVPGDLAIVCFRAVQEALTNVIRHAQAQHVRIELHQTDSTLELAVSDDGVGFDVAKTLDQAPGCGHLGLLGMKERVQILGGEIEVDSEPRRGTRIRISLPTVAPSPSPQSKT
jgi:two-component system, NarL family, sensor histidine kinase UhpB